jgi:S1-C subfamily serine protease
MGVTVKNASDYMQSDVIPSGAYIDKVNKDSAADLAGLMAGDIIVKFGNDEITCLADLQDTLPYYKKGQTITVTVQRRDKYGEYKEISVEITLQEKPAQ